MSTFDKGGIIHLEVALEELTPESLREVGNLLVNRADTPAEAAEFLQMVGMKEYTGRVVKNGHVSTWVREPQFDL